MLFCLRTLLRTTLQKTNRPFYLLHMDLQYVPVCASNLWQWANIDRYIQRENLCLIIAFYWQKPMDRRLGKSEKQCRIYDSDLKCALQPDLWVHQVRCATQVNFSVPLVKWTGVCASVLWTCPSTVFLSGCVKLESCSLGTHICFLSTCTVFITACGL